MKKTGSFVAVLLAILFVFGHSAPVAGAEWRFDPPHSSFRFAVKHIYSTVHGYFDDYSGTVNFEPDNLAASKVNFKIKVDGIQTQVSQRDNHLRSPDFFDAGKYPYIVFDSTAITHAGGDHYEVAGKLTIKDVTRDIVLPFTYYGVKDHPASPGDEVMGFDAAITLNRLDYHVGDGKFYRMGIVDKDVNVAVSVEMLRKK